VAVTPTPSISGKWFVPQQPNIESSTKLPHCAHALLVCTVVVWVKICPARLQILWAIDTTKRSSNTNSGLVEHMIHIHSFEQEIRHLLLRYKDGATVLTGKMKRVAKMKNLWATPPAIMASCNGTYTLHERFASPLNFHQGMRTDSSCHERDQVFGATWTAFSVKWSGVSQCNRLSMKTTLTLCVVLPAWAGNSYTAYNRVS
jgi:hypothetical protein